MEETSDYPDCVKDCLDDESLPISAVKTDGETYLLIDDKAKKRSHESHEEFTDRMACLLKCYYDFRLMQGTKDTAKKKDILKIMAVELERMSKKDFELDT